MVVDDVNDIHAKVDMIYCSVSLSELIIVNQQFFSVNEDTREGIGYRNATYSI